MDNNNVKKPQHGFTGLWIPAEIVENDEVAWLEKCIYAYIHSLSKSERGCFASNKHFGKIFHISASSASRCISHLVKANLVKEDTALFNGRERILKPTVKYYSKDK